MDDDEPAESAFRPLFDGVSLAGWHPAPRVLGAAWPGGPEVRAEVVGHGPVDRATAEARPAAWRVEDGAIVGAQGTPGFGGYLVSDAAFGDFELRLQVDLDWPADSGVMVRRLRDSWEGLQILVDHRPGGSIGGFYGNGLAGFHALSFGLEAARDAEGRPVGLVEQDPEETLEPITAAKRALLRRAGTAAEFLAAWRFGDWNDLRIRCVGELPVLTTWVNGVLVGEVDVASVDWPHFDPDAVRRVLGRAGHLAFEVHDNDPLLGADRWGAGAECRWRAIRIAELDAG